MKIGIIGASGKAGNLIMKEAIERGNEVTAIVRDASKITEQNVGVLVKDVLDLTSDDLKKFDVVVNAFGAPLGQEHLHVEAGKVLINALKETPHTRIIVVGGAGSLYVDEAKTIRIFETPNFPAQFLATATNQGKNLEDLKQSKEIQWSFISPSALFDPEGPRTGSYQTGKDHLLFNSKGDSYLSYADFAIAVLDEIEHPRHINERFTLVSEKE
ncbi:NAD(P)-dependent oxidoreductase [Bacillus sp. 03113]|uniref:NAD(P)-dependent oxidoreductase n=1 Tax=Bacillus sp. 03113 TaxID=2578211 RepID=UPI001142E493|nr:NAD(P)-dependent oxidoreductase [Bacillus sp. 03113]